MLKVNFLEKEARSARFGVGFPGREIRDGAPSFNIIPFYSFCHVWNVIREPFLITPSYPGLYVRWIINNPSQKKKMNLHKNVSKILCILMLLCVYAFPSFNERIFFRIIKFMYLKAWKTVTIKAFNIEICSLECYKIQ